MARAISVNVITVLIIMGRRVYCCADHNAYGHAWNIVFKEAVDKWLETWDHSGDKCKCSACKGIISSIHWILVQGWPKRELTRIVGWLTYRETVDRKHVPSAYYRRMATRKKNKDREKLARALKSMEGDEDREKLARALKLIEMDEDLLD